MNDNADDTVRRYLITLHTENAATWRKIGEHDFQDKIPAATLCAYAHGRKIVNNEHRKALGLLELKTVPANMVRKTRPPGSGERSTRAARAEIALSDPVKARARLEKKLAEYHGKEV